MHLLTDLRHAAGFHERFEDNEQIQVLLGRRHFVQAMSLSFGKLWEFLSLPRSLHAPYCIAFGITQAHEASAR